MQLLRGLFGGRQEAEQQQADVLGEAQARAQQRPGDAKAHFDLGSIYYVRGRFEEAVSALERAVELAPDHGEANYMLGLAYAKLARADDARRAFQMARDKTDNLMLQNYAQQRLNELGSREVQEQG